jgi:glycosyltransferase involved in cell wall biosynthesis
LREDDRAAYDKIALFFVGNGPEKAALLRHPEVSRHGHVFFFDPLAKSPTMAAMERADFVLVHFAGARFKRYGMSANKLYDAMAVGRPVLLATPLDDTPVDAVQCGIRYEPGSVPDLTVALARGMSLTPAEARAMGARGRMESEARYSLEVTSGQLEKLLLDVVGP